MIPIEQILVLLLTSHVCTCCKTRKSRSEFYADKRREHGLMVPCKECVIESRRLKYVSHPRVTFAPEVQAERDRASRRVWAAKNPQKLREAIRNWKKKNPQKVRETQRRWLKENPEKRRVYKARKLQNPEFKLLEKYRIRIWGAIKRNHKSAKTRELLGCSEGILKAHLEALFVPGMTWENYGPVWHVDHKRPCASFDLSVPAQQRECFHFTNLQPLFAADNFAKGAKIL